MTFPPRIFPGSDHENWDLFTDDWSTSLDEFGLRPARLPDRRHFKHVAASLPSAAMAPRIPGGSSEAITHGEPGGAFSSAPSGPVPFSTNVSRPTRMWDGS